MSKKGVLVIINPNSGSRLKPNISRLSRSILDENKFDIRIVTTEYAGHATLLAQKAIEEKFQYVIAVGGDGTINEIAKALTHSDIALGIIPIGSGNGLARHLNIPMDIRSALEIINLELVEKIDFCVANEQLFFTTCGVGFDARVSYQFSKSKLRGGFNYLRSMMIEYLSYRPETYEILIDGETTTEKAFLITCANASQYGNNAFIAPQADLKDGKMDVAILSPFTPFDIATIGLQLFTKQIDKNSKIKIIETDNITILRQQPGEIHLDGEPMWMDSNIKVYTVAGGLRVLVPDGEKKKESPIQLLFELLFQQIRSLRNYMEIPMQLK
ncbi:MAG: diacylglycerol kinase family lipid kinase [Bacteroidales bacterium]|nr:diacylglycerol kinase family lipid kinase [Bacteroidales bacterium]